MPSQVGFLAAFAGGVLSALLIQDSKVAPIALLTSNSVGVTWTVCWWLVNYCPGNLVARAMSWLPCRLVARVSSPDLQQTACGRRSAASLLPHQEQHACMELPMTGRCCCTALQ